MTLEVSTSKGESANGFWFSKAQRQIIAAGLTAAALVVLASTVMIILGVIRDGIVLFSNVIWPLAVAAIFTVLLRPLVFRIEARTGWSRTRSVVLLYTVVGGLGLVFASFAIVLIVNQLTSALQELPAMYQNVAAFLSERFPGLVEAAESRLGADRVKSIGDELASVIQQLSVASVPMLRTVGEQILYGLQIATLVGIIPVYLFYFLLMDYDAIGGLAQQLDFIKDKWREDIVTLVGDFVGYVMAFFRGQIVVAAITGLMLAAGFSLIGLQFGLLFGLLLGALNIIPYLGTIIGLGSALPVAFFQPEGGPFLVGLVLAVFIIVQTLESNIVSPRIMGKETGLHPVVIIVAIFFWGITLDGILGMILGVPLTAFLISGWGLLKRRYLAQSGWFGKENDGDAG